VIITNSTARLSGFKKPKVGSGPRYMRNKMTSKSKKGKGSGKGRHFGKLAQLLNMPLDVFFEVCVSTLLTLKFANIYFASH
jgi:hypothetical protein